ncbi:hypothetical protein NIES37_62570 [Tolypothrix tenuis PCC 7101]|uniref:Uncharacterized protein n=1 Tax=Tolypothrix tenuis PCC 7101 TaxID=231146 RepID=A0A1Z4N980_9CYAN|nr:hypothetical protein [Aulosira sp. FACHB-113]BAZ02245.1 hypothetical protein NIES37_62570 [Tolypothrix tenuis PCC 7101]BAZ73834.1 hypothetical protein NIES50_24000 [Aulosira laxa NIES-50]
MTGIHDRLNWDLVVRTKLTPVKFPNKPAFFKPLTVIVNSRILMIGMRNRQAKDTWRYAGTAYMNLFTLPSSTSLFAAGVETARQDLRLGTLTLIQFPELQLYPYYVEVRVPPWHQEMLVEVWQYSGDEVDVIKTSIDEIKSTLNNL